MGDDILIAKAMYTHLNSWPDKPCQIRMETMDKAPIAFSISIQQLSGTVYLKKYIDGSFTGAWPFAVYVRLSGNDTAKKFDAVNLLEQLSEWMRVTPPPDIGSRRTADRIEMTALPSVAGIYEDGGIDYQAVFRLIYKQRSDYNG